MPQGNALRTTFENTGLPFRFKNAQEAIAELRDQSITTPDFTVTTLNGTLALAATSRSTQYLTGSATGFSVQLPAANTLYLGMKIEVVNTSSAPITIKDGSGATLFLLGQTSIGFMQLQDNGSAAGTWVYYQTFISTATGIVSYYLTSAVNFSTTSTTDVLITGFTLTPVAGTYACWYNAAAFLNTTPRQHWWSFYKAGVKLTDSERTQDTSHSNEDMSDATMTITQFNGAQAIDVRVRTENGTLQINNRSMVLIRLGV